MRFQAGNKAAVGHKCPAARRAQILKRVVQTTLTRKDVRDIVLKLIEQGKTGDIPSIRTLFDYALGRPEPMPMVLSGDEEHIVIEWDPSLKKILRHQDDDSRDDKPMAGTFNEVEIPLDGDDSD
jgi:hypothetical protein